MFNRLNWQPDLPDFRDYPFTGSIAVESLPASVDLRPSGYLHTDSVATDNPILELFAFVVRKEFGPSQVLSKLRTGFGSSVKNSLSTSIRSEVKLIAQRFLLLPTNYSRLAVNTDTMKQCLADGYPFVFGFTTYTSFDSSTGQIDIPLESESVIGNKIMLAVGYDEQNVILKTYDGLGDNGYYYMPYAYIANNNLCDDFWTVRRG